MNVTFSGFSGATAFALPETPTTERLEAFISATDFEEPTLVVDRQLVAAQYAALAHGLGNATIHYAMKANPAREIMETLRDLGSGFDAASRGEIEQCLALGIPAARISFGNTIKRARDIAFAHQAGVTLFAADAEEELEKIAAHAPGAQVYIRLLVGATEADWPLSRKFGCAPERALELLDRANALGLDPLGLSFHVGSQTRRADMWVETLNRVAAVWAEAHRAGHALRMINIGGGFPVDYGDGAEAPGTYAAEVMRMVRARFGDQGEVMAEPGRGLVGAAGIIAAEVVLVSRKSDSDLCRWVYLDIGKFSGLAETEDEAIRYEITTERDHESLGPCILAGPSCDSVDVLYEKRPVMMPLGLQAGDKVMIHATGAYTSTYASVGFNGFPPLAVVVI